MTTKNGAPGSDTRDADTKRPATASPPTLLGRLVQALRVRAEEAPFTVAGELQRLRLHSLADFLEERCLR